MRLICCATLIFTVATIASPSDANAQQNGGASSPTSQAPGDNSVADVVVVGERAAVTESTDRKSYNLVRDLTAANGSVSDVLRNIPSVEVSAEGEISVRGNSSAQILVDGEPSTMFSGPNRAQALRQLPANTVESIEIMTNPSAEFGPDGTGGVINIVSKKVRVSFTGRLSHIDISTLAHVTGGLYLGYQCKFNANLFLVAMVSDIFESTRFSTVTDAPNLLADRTTNRRGACFL